MLLTRRNTEVPESRLSITAILWNLCFVWTEELTALLMETTDLQVRYGLQVTMSAGSPFHGELLDDCFATADSGPSEALASTIRLAVLSATRLVVSDRLPPNLSLCMVGFRSSLFLFCGYES
jgi:hypothetical protein